MSNIHEAIETAQPHRGFYKRLVEIGATRCGSCRNYHFPEGPCFRMAPPATPFEYRCPLCERGLWATDLVTVRGCPEAACGWTNRSSPREANVCPCEHADEAPRVLQVVTERGCPKCFSGEGVVPIADAEPDADEIDQTLGVTDEVRAALATAADEAVPA
jgi:hypothetical protein